MSRIDDYTAGNLLNCLYHQKYYKQKYEEYCNYSSTN